ncbi:MAG: hypothetical protein AABZ12_06645 [Planctomycetota bacterium]
MEGLRFQTIRRLALVCGLFAAGCGGQGFFNPAFVNTLVGGEFPVTPGPGAAFVLVRGLNDTAQNVEFVVAIEREVLVRDEQGNFQVDDQGIYITKTEREIARLLTGATGLARDMGVLFPCNESPVTSVGVEQVAVGGEGAGGAGGVAVDLEGVNALLLSASNFNCGDTIIFRAFRSTGTPGGVRVRTFLLPGSEQPSIFSGPDTFANYAAFLQQQVRETP